jgi:histidinol phosphatase-like enzyme (inositol monophosphatase family)
LISAARAAGQLQRRRFRRAHRVETKADDTPVTQTDRESETRIRRILEAFAPDFDFLGEESYTSDQPLEPLRTGSRWIVDPLDGTKKFVRGLPFFGPCLALEEAGNVVAGVIHVPVLNELYVAEAGRGASLNGAPIHVSEQSALDRAYVVYANEVEFYRRGWGATLERLIGSTYHNPGFLDLYTYGALAAGRLDAVVMIGESPWDVAAAQVIVEEAGGRFTDFRGRHTVYGGTTVATNGRIHDDLLTLLADCGSTL